jgi:hypothetical protein
MSVFFSIRGRLNTIEKEAGQVRRILFGDRGNLNIIDVQACKANRDQVFLAIRRGEQVQEMLLKRIEELNKNVLIIMVHLNIRSPNSTALEDICKSDE